MQGIQICVFRNSYILLSSEDKWVNIPVMHICLFSIKMHKEEGLEYRQRDSMLRNKSVFVTLSNRVAKT